MNELQKVFHYSGNVIRTIVKNDEIWFVAKDVAEILEYTDADAMTRYLDEDEKQNLQLVGFKRGAILINEAGLYSAILKSRKQEAKQFKRWITHEVLPAIRKHGAYLTENTLEKALSNPDFLIQLATNLKEEQEKRKIAEEKIQQQQPLVTFAETCMSSNRSLLIREVAKLCSKQGVVIGEKRLWQKLRDWGLIFKKKNEPMQEYVDRGYFEISQGVKETSKGALTWLTIRVTTKGQIYIINKLRKELNAV